MSKNNFCCVDDFEKFALKTLPKQAADYYSSGAEHGFTLGLNREAFQSVEGPDLISSTCQTMHENFDTVGDLHRNTEKDSGGWDSSISAVWLFRMGGLFMPLPFYIERQIQLEKPWHEQSVHSEQPRGTELPLPPLIYTGLTNDFPLEEYLERAPEDDVFTSKHVVSDTFPCLNCWTRLRIRPRMLIDVTNLSPATTVFGERVSMPIGIAPTAMQKMAHPCGECANAKAAGALGTIFTLSTISTSSVEEVAAAAPHTLKWFQLYIYKDREVTKRLVQRAEKNGFKALVLTVDAPFFGIRYADERNQFSLPPHLRLANFVDEKATQINEVKDNQSSLSAYVNSLFDQGLTWNDVKWLKSITSLPIVLKGILTAEDALIAANLGVAGIQVSNHGARQLDTTPASIEALPEIVKAVGDRCEIFFDGGIRNGTDVFKALALGAKMVFVGRPALWGLAYDGQLGVEKVLNILKKELNLAMALAGCTSVDDITKPMVVHESFYSRL